MRPKGYTRWWRSRSLRGRRANRKNGDNGGNGGNGEELNAEEWSIRRRGEYTVQESVRNFVCGAYHEEYRCPGRANRSPTDIPETIWDQFGGPARPMSQGEVDAITKRLKMALVERMLGGELTHHLGYPPGGEKPPDATNHRNGTSALARVAEHHRRLVESRELLASDDEPVLRCCTRIASSCRGRNMPTRMDAAVALDAQNAPTATWKTARGFPQRPHASLSTRPTHKKTDTPNAEERRSMSSGEKILLCTLYSTVFPPLLLNLRSSAFSSSQFSPFSP